MTLRALVVVAAALLGAVLAGCPGDNRAPSSSGTAPTATGASTGAATGAATGSGPAAPPTGAAGMPPPPHATATGPEPYEGPTGTITGVITIKGDEPPRTPFKYPAECEGAAGSYGKLFRVGQDGQLADAIVAVTHYDGFVPPKNKSVEVNIKNCQYSQRSIALTDTQYLSIFNRDAIRSYIPHLDGARLPATMVAVPRGPELKIYTRGKGRYWLRDQMKRDFMTAHVFHFPYSTTHVTGLDGRYRIAGIPVGKAKVSVLLPQTTSMLSTQKDIEVKEGDNAVDLELTFDAKRDTPPDGHGGTKLKAGLAPSPSASAAASGTPL
jgi:hypothetical protein